MKILFEIFWNTLANYVIFNMVYYVCSGILFVLDYHKCFVEKKIQNQTNHIDIYKKCLPTVAWNTLICSFVPCLFFGWYQIMELPFDLVKMIIDLILVSFLSDIFFYTLHRLLHVSFIYKKYHKKHHQIIAPIGLSAVYMTTLDFYLGNIVPIYLPLCLVGAHSLTVRIWMILTTINTVVVAHSGFDKLANFHDKHHSAFNKNYGTNLFMDRIFGTYE
jgi:Sterol desaturase